MHMVKYDKIYRVSSEIAPEPELKNVSSLSEMEYMTGQQTINRLICPKAVSVGQVHPRFKSAASAIHTVQAVGATNSARANRYCVCGQHIFLAYNACMRSVLGCSSHFRYSPLVTATVSIVQSQNKKKWSSTRFPGRIFLCRRFDAW